MYRSGLFFLILGWLLSIGAVYAQGGEAAVQVDSLPADGKEKTEPIDGWTVKEYHTKQELKEIRRTKWREMEEWEREHFTTPGGRWYFGIRAGYTVPYLTIQNKPPEKYLGSSDLFIGDDGDILNRGLYSANAGGARFGVFAGYMFNQYIGVEADFGFNYYRRIVLGRNNTPTYKSELVTWSRDMSFMPQLVFNTPNIRNFYFYAKVGFFIPFWGGTSGEAFVDDIDGTFLKDLAGQPVSGFLTLADIIAQELGMTVDELAFLEDGLLPALGYHVTLDADVEIDLRPDADVFGFTGTLGGRLQISELVSLMTEFRVAGYNISTKRTTVANLDLRGSLLGNPDFIVLNEEGGFVNGVPVPKENLEFLLVTDYRYELTEASNHADYNPNGLDPTKPSEQLADRKSAYGFTMSVGIQFNFGGKKKSKAAE